MTTLLIALGALALYMSALFVVSLVTKNNGVADIGYGIAFIVFAGTAFALLETSEYTSFLFGLVIAWGIRLASRIYRKNRGKPEDFRYKAWRDAWGATFVWRSFLQIYMLQGAVVALVASPVVLAIIFPQQPVIPVYALGVTIWIIGFLFESIGDHQLDVFIRNPENKGKIMTSGLWQYTRHPNYFGESLMWWGIAIAASTLTTVPYVGFLSPVLITYLLLFVSGIPMLEKRWEGNPEWESYKVRTSAFIPLPPRTK